MSGLLQRNMSMPIWVLMERMSSSIPHHNNTYK
jgi:hypothetical protein